MTVAAARPHTDAVVAALEAVGLLVGRGERPEGAGWQGEADDTEFEPYVVLYPFPGQTDSEVLCDPHEYLDYRVQATCVGARQEGAEAVADTVKAALVGVRLTVPDRSVWPFYVLLDRAAERDDKVAPPLHFSVLQLGCRSGPA